MAYNQRPAPFAHWMKREIYEQPGTLAATLEQYVDANGGLESCKNMQAWLREAQAELVIAASGSSRHAAQVAELFLEDRSGIAVNVRYASEYKLRARGTLPDSA